VAALAAGLVLASEDRKRYGLILGESVGFNLSLSFITRLRRGLLIDEEREAHANQALFQSLGVKAPSALYVTPEIVRSWSCVVKPLIVPSTRVIFTKYASVVSSPFR